jgi:phosphoribosylamine--glycine ligase
MANPDGKLNVLLIGQGGREHAIAWKVSQSPRMKKLYISPGNAGTLELGENINLDINNFNEVKDFVINRDINLVIVGPEDPLVNGIHDFFLNDRNLHSVPVIGPVAKAAMLEGSKDFAKEFMIKYHIPTARFRTFDITSIHTARAFLDSLKPPYVLKADGLAAGKGVLICDTKNQALEELSEMIENRKFGNASKKVVIEEFLKGIELSVFVLTDGISYKLLPEAKDYKRVGEGDTGLNTGGMGSVSPVPFAGKSFMDKVEHRIIQPTLKGLKTENLKFQGFIFFGLMNVSGDPYLIEYNVRMGDPEAESVIPRLKSDLLDLFISAGDSTLNDKMIETDERYCASVFLVSGGYPGNYKRGNVITELDKIKGSLVFHAGTKKDPASQKILTNGGRVIAVSSFGNTMEQALENSYKNAAAIQFDGKYYRKDIGRDLL